MEDLDFSLVIKKLLTRLIYEKEDISIEEFIDKYKLPNKIKNRIKQHCYNITLTEMAMLLDYLDMKVSEFMILLEKELKDDLQ